MPYAQIDNLQMYYEAFGPPDDVPLLVLHGAGGTIDDPAAGWAALTPSFAEAFRVIAVEHRGHGRTNNPAESMSFVQIADDVAELVRQLGLAPAHIAGISDGGVVALDLAVRRPEMTRSVTVVGANYCVHDGIWDFAATLDPDALERAAPEAATEFARRHDQGKYAGYWKELLRQIVANNTANPSWSESDLGRIRCPVLLIAGEDDPFATPDQMFTMKRAIRNAEWLIVNHAGHPVHFEFPEIVGPRILDFLQRNTN